MRRILVDYARARQAIRRGGGQERVALLPTKGGGVLPPEASDAETDFVALDAALDRFGVTYPRPSQVVELRFVGGMHAVAAS